MRTFEVDRGSVSEGGVAPAGFVPGLDPLEDRRGEFARVAHERRSRSSICIEPEKDSMRVSTAQATFPLDPIRPA